MGESIKCLTLGKEHYYYSQEHYFYGKEHYFP